MTIYWNTFVTFHKVFCARCGTNCIDFWYLPSSLLFILTRVPTHKKNRILCYPLRSNSGWLPIRYAYFILNTMSYIEINNNQVHLNQLRLFSYIVGSLYFWKIRFSRLFRRCLLISSLPDKALRTLVDIARLAERFNKRSQSRAW